MPRRRVSLHDERPRLTTRGRAYTPAPCREAHTNPCGLPEPSRAETCTGAHTCVARITPSPRHPVTLSPRHPITPSPSPSTITLTSRLHPRPHPHPHPHPHLRYGSSELPQGFCRLCAVWGGICMLNGRGFDVEVCPIYVAACMHASMRTCMRGLRCAELPRQPTHPPLPTSTCYLPTSAPLTLAPASALALALGLTRTLTRTLTLRPLHS